jgi:heat shock protein HtpX
MAVAGSILFGFYMLLAIVALSYGAPLILVLLGTVLFAGFQYKFGKWAALRSVGAEDMPRDRFPDVHDAVDRLCGEMDLEKPDLKVAEMGVPNAFAVGRRGAGVVVVSTELMHLLGPEELEAVLAHELAHIDNRDVVTMVMGQAVASLLGFAAYFVVAFSREGGLGNILVGYLASIVVQSVAMVFVLAISRYREYVADDDAARHVGGDAMASALEQISSAGTRGDAEVNDNVSALCIFGGERSALERLFATHPPIEKRIAAVRGVAREFY